MHTTYLLIAAIVAAIVMLSNSRRVENYGGDYAEFGNTNFPGGDLDSTRVASKAECEKLCDDLDACKGYVMNNKVSKQDKKYGCWLKNEEGVAATSRKRDTSKRSFIQKDYYNFWKNEYKAQVGSFEDGLVKKRGCIGKVTVYDNTNYEGDAREYGCGTFDFSTLIGATWKYGHGVSSIKIPNGLRVKFYNEAGEPSGWQRGDNPDLGEGWADKVMKIDVRRTD